MFWSSTKNIRKKNTTCLHTARVVSSSHNIHIGLETRSFIACFYSNTSSAPRSTSWWVDDEWIFIPGWTIPLREMKWDLDSTSSKWAVSLREFVVTVICQVMIWRSWSPPDFPSRQMDSFHFLCCYRHQMSRDSVCVDLFLQTRLCDTAGRWVKALWKSNRSQKTSAIITSGTGPETATWRRRVQIWAGGQLWWSLCDTRGAAESFDKSSSLTWSLWGWTINQLDSFIQTEEQGTAELLSSSHVSINRQPAIVQHGGHMFVLEHLKKR